MRQTNLQHAYQSSSQQLGLRERKREQNRIAQRKYRQNQKQRLRALEETIGQSSLNGLPTSEEPSRQRPLNRLQALEKPSGPQNPLLDLEIDTTQDMLSQAPEENGAQDTAAVNLSPRHDSVLCTRENSSTNTTAKGLWTPQATPDDPFWFGDVPVLTMSLTSTKPWCSALHRAACNGSEAITRTLLDAGADAKKQDSAGQTALHLAVQSGSVGVAKLILEEVDDPNVLDVTGRTALFTAVQGGDLEMVKVLLEAGVDVNHKDAAGSVVLHVAVDAGLEALTSLLIAYGAEVDA